MKKIIGLSVLSLFLVFCGTKESTATKKEEPVVKTSGIVLDHFDKNIRPVDDLFRHVNGKWLNEAKIPEDKTRFGVFNELFDKNEAQLKAIVDDISSQKELADGSNDQKIRDLYLSFLNTEKREALKLDPIADDFKAIDQAVSLDDMLAVMVSQGMKGVDIPVSFHVDQDSKNATAYIGYFSQSGLGLPDRDYYFKEGEPFQTIRQKYMELIEKQWNNAGFTAGETAARQIMAIESNLAAKQWTRVQNRDSEKTYNKFTTDELKTLAPGLNWNIVLDAMGLSGEKAFIVVQPDYMTYFGTLLKKQPISEWKTYLKWKVLSQNASLLTQAMDDANFEFYGKVLSGVGVQRPQWKRSIQIVNRVLGDALGQIYVKRHFPPEAKQRMDVLVKNLIQAYDDALSKLEWMSPETRKAAREKLAKVTPKIGYPAKWKDYSEIKIAPDTLQANLESASLWEYHRMLAKLGKPIDRAEWFMSPQTVNAYYNEKMNEIVFPAGILQPPMFNLEADDAVNYGAIGMIIGHELGHAFDDQGSRSDGDGNLNNWWTDQDRTEFEKRTKMLVDEYDAFSPLEGVHVNGKLTLGENIGDLGGATIAYRAYMILLDGKEAPVLDGFTGPQRFFLGLAQLWRNKIRDEALRQRIMTDPHSPAEFRVNGVVTNMPEFYAAFGVKEGDKLYRTPENRVKIW